MVAAARAHQDYIAGETLATEIGYESLPDASDTGDDGEAGGQAAARHDGAQPVTIDGRALKIGVAVA
jgi:hypothetical protein